MKLDHFNESQRQAILHGEGPCVVYAGAGSGKTRVICSRIARLIESGVPPYSILAVTFTNKAAREMRERIEGLVGRAAQDLIVSTFHAFCARFLRIHGRHAGYTEAFSIYDDGDTKSVLKDILKASNVPEKTLPIPVLKGFIEQFKNKGILPGDARIFEWNEKENQELKKKRFFGETYDMKLVASLYAAYQDQLKKDNALDFNDILLVFDELLKNNPDVLAQLQRRFRYFLIDEFQDTNPIQYDIVARLSAHTRNMFIVGDDDQSIYSWRGAEPSFILNFSTLYPDTKVFKLETNYRSSSNIVEAAQNLIKNNKTRAPKTMVAGRPQGQMIELSQYEDPYHEAERVVLNLRTKLESDPEFGNYAILYRTNAQSRLIEDELRRKMLPYVIFGGTRFYERAEIKTLLSYLKVIVNPQDSQSFERILNTPKRALGAKTLDTLKECGTSLFEIARQIAFHELDVELSPRVKQNLRMLIELLLRLRHDLLNGASLSLIFQTLLSETHFETYITEQFEDHEDRVLNMIELKNALTEFENSVKIKEDALTKLETLVSFLEHVSLTLEANKEESNAITLMTIHSSKGLEFPHLFIIGLEEGVLPHQNSFDNPQAIEEERRLLYVAMTRARESLSLSYSLKNRFRDFMSVSPSRFLEEIPPELFRSSIKEKREPKRTNFAESNRSNFAQSHRAETPSFPARQSVLSGGSASFDKKKHLENLVFKADELSGVTGSWRTGEKVSHSKFGMGRVKGAQKSKNGFKVTVDFEKEGLKVLMDEFLIRQDN